MKILIYGLNFRPESVGIGKYSSEMASFLANRSHNVRVITSQPYFPAWSIFNSYRNQFSTEILDGILINRCPLWIPRRPTGLTRLLHLSSFALSSFWLLLIQLRWHPDVVITVAPAFFCAPGALLFGRLCGRRTISWLHIQDFELDAAFELGLLNGRFLRLIAELFERLLLRSFDLVSSISFSMVNRLKSKGVNPNRAVLLSNWVDLKDIRPCLGSSRLTNCYRRELNIGPDQLVLMYSGSMNKKQGLDLLVDVIHLLADVPNLVWLFAGDGPSKAELVAATHGLSHVHHLPLQPNDCLNDWLNAADVHLLPQRSEAADLVLPSKLLGMLASGRPVVASSPPGTELALLTEQVGACVPPGDASAFASSLRQLIHSPQRREALGSKARLLAEERFGMDAVLIPFEKHLSSLINGL